MKLIIKLIAVLLFLFQLSLSANGTKYFHKNEKVSFIKTYKKVKTVDEKIKLINRLKDKEGKVVIRLLIKLLQEKDDKIKSTSLEILSKIKNPLAISTDLIIKELKNRKNSLIIKIKSAQLLTDQELNYRSIYALTEALNALNLSPPKKQKANGLDIDLDSPYVQHQLMCTLGNNGVQKFKNLQALNEQLEKAPKNYKNQIENFHLSQQYFASIYILTNKEFQAESLNLSTNKKIYPWFKKNKRSLNIWWEKNKKKIAQTEKTYLKKLIQTNNLKREQK